METCRAKHLFLRIQHLQPSSGASIERLPVMGNPDRQPGTSLASILLLSPGKKTRTGSDPVTPASLLPRIAKAHSAPSVFRHPDNNNEEENTENGQEPNKALFTSDQGPTNRCNDHPVPEEDGLMTGEKDGLLLDFQKGDRFEILDRDGERWWAVRNLSTNDVGYVPVNYVEIEEKSAIELPSLSAKSNRKLHLKALTDRQKKVGLQHPDRLYPNMIPEPDYSDGDDDGRGNQHSRDEEDGLIVPKKLPNPCTESIERKKLHQELLFNQKHGKNVLNQKSELQRAMEKHRDQQARKEIEQQKQSTLTPFQRVLEERAKKLESVDKEDDEKVAGEPENEFLKVHAKVRARLDSK